MARITPVLVAVSLALVGCSSPTSSPVGPAPTDTAHGTGGTSIDCTVLKAPSIADYIVGIQVLAQLRSQDSVDLIKSGTLAYDPTVMESTLTALKALAGHGVPGLGDPGPDVDFFLGANSLAKDILATDGPVPQAKFDAIAAYEGDVGTFLGHQLSINAALGEVCP